MTRVRVLIVDDSATMRHLLAGMLRRDPQIEIVGEAADATQARAMIKALEPDVVTLDVEMPGMNGLDFLEKIMALHPMPVVIVSSATERGAAATLRALEAGAFDCFLKPATAAGYATDTLALLIRQAARCPNRTAPATRRRSVAATYAGSDTILAIGASTGGVEALIEVVGGLPANCPPTVIVQHMPAMFTGGFAERLDRLCPPKVAHARGGALLERGHVYLAPGGLQCEVVGANAPRLRIYEGERVGGHCPAVDVMFRSVARLGRPAIGVILTGMGADGAAGLLEMRRTGARTLGQDEASCVVYGMPAAAHALGAVEHQLPLSQIAARAMELAHP